MGLTARLAPLFYVRQFKFYICQFKAKNIDQHSDQYLEIILHILFC